MASNIKTEIRNSWGENRPIDGPYDPSVAAGCRNGIFVGTRKDGVKIFRGIPFACPPTGDKRWKKPLPAEDSDRVFEAKYNGRTPIQTEWHSERASYYPQGEDCLYLNIWTGETAAAGKTVMVFIHGGSYGWGGTADPLYDGFHFAKAHPEIVLVTIAYRVGMMGFADFSSVPGGEAFPDAPNLGIWDQIEALRWIRKNIAAFGGDPDKVTIFGESAGGGSVSLLPFIPEARGLFRRVIAESGSVALTYSKEECQGLTRRIMKAAGAANMRDLLMLTEKELQEVNEKVNMYNNFPQRDGVLIPEDPYEPYRNGLTADVDMLIGTNADETNYWINEVGGFIPFRMGLPIQYENNLRLLKPEDRKRARQYMKLTKGYSLWKISGFFTEIMFRLPAVRQAEEHSRNGGKAFMYFWEERSHLPHLRACHAVELAYVFGNVEDTVYTGKPADPALSRQVQDQWVRFAEIGDPGTPELLWPAYEEKNRWTMILRGDSRLAADPMAEERKVLSPILDYCLNASYAEMKFNVPFVWKTAGKILLFLLLIIGLVLYFLLK
ncbi:MAG: carboxylesterase/lipase family protein [Clostridia bacterium]|nr:carboxylesterase/lipase family protein [Clostridia bacterium]